MLQEGHTVEGRKWNFTPPGKLFNLQKKTATLDPPSPAMSSTQCSHHML